MLYEAKQKSKSYEYIKSILDAELEECQAYIKRVEEAIGFKFEKYQGYRPNTTLSQECARLLLFGYHLSVTIHWIRRCGRR